MGTSRLFTMLALRRSLIARLPQLQPTRSQGLRTMHTAERNIVAAPHVDPVDFEFFGVSVERYDDDLCTQYFDRPQGAQRMHTENKTERRLPTFDAHTRDMEITVRIPCVQQSAAACTQ